MMFRNTKYLLLLTGIFLSQNAFTLTQTFGYWLPGPNRFWSEEFGVFAGSTNSTNSQLNLAHTNPDVFCEMQEGDWRLPSIGEFNSAHRSTKVFGSKSGLSHPMSYPNPSESLISQTILPNDPNRAATGSIWNEWGDVSKYPNAGFSASSQHFYTAEPNAATRRTVYVSTTGASGYYEYTVLVNAMCIHDIR